MYDGYTEKLFRLYPITFLGRFMPGTENLIGEYGIEAPDGWFDIIKNLSEKIENYNRILLGKDNLSIVEYRELVKNQSDKVPLIADQVKSKFAGLRFYTNKMIPVELKPDFDEAESKAACTCEICGKPGTVMKTSGGYYYVACNEHIIKED